MRLDLLQHIAKHMTWHHDQQVAAGGNGAGQVRFRGEIVGERNIGQKGRVAAVCLELRKVRRIMSPQLYRIAVTGQRNRQSGAVGAGTDDANRSVCGHQAS